MMKYFEKRVEANEKGEEKFLGLSDYDVLGEDLAIILAMCDQLTLYDTLLTCHPDPEERHLIDIATDTLWGLGQGIINIVEELQDKIRIIETKFEIRIKEEYKRALAAEDSESPEN